MKYDTSTFKDAKSIKEVGDRKFPRGGGGDYTLGEVKKGGNGNRYYKDTIYGKKGQARV
jgi:hypothetical protein